MWRSRHRKNCKIEYALTVQADCVQVRGAHRGTIV